MFQTPGQPTSLQPLLFIAEHSAAVLTTFQEWSPAQRSPVTSPGSHSEDLAQEGVQGPRLAAFSCTRCWSSKVRDKSHVGSHADGPRGQDPEASRRACSWGVLGVPGPAKVGLTLGREVGGGRLHPPPASGSQLASDCPFACLGPRCLSTGQDGPASCPQATASWPHD